jgi:hypothetical protein
MPGGCAEKRSLLFVLLWCAFRLPRRHERRNSFAHIYIAFASLSRYNTDIP